VLAVMAVWGHVNVEPTLANCWRQSQRQRCGWPMSFSTLPSDTTRCSRAEVEAKRSFIV